MESNPYQDTVDAANKVSDDAVKNLDADLAFKARDLGRVWESAGRVVSGTETEQDRLFIRQWQEDYYRRHPEEKPDWWDATH